MDALAGVEAVRDQHDHVLLARLQILRGVLPDVAGELVESDAVRGAIAVECLREFPQQGGPARFRVAPGEIAEDPDPTTADRRDRNHRGRSAGKSGAQGWVLTDLPAGTAVLGHPEPLKSGESPVHEWFPRLRLQVANHPYGLHRGQPRTGCLSPSANSMDSDVSNRIQTRGRVVVRTTPRGSRPSSRKFWPPPAGAAADSSASAQPQRRIAA